MGYFDTSDSIMETLKIAKSWEEFKPFVDNELVNIDTFNIGYMFKGDEIIIRCEDDSILEIIKQAYTLTPCEIPAKDIDEFHYWRYFGNSSFFRD